MNDIDTILLDYADKWVLFLHRGKAGDGLTATQEASKALTELIATKQAEAYKKGYIDAAIKEAVDE